MGYANYIGRVGALAVALGIGAAVATQPGLALAEESGSPADSSTGSPSTSGSNGSPKQSALSEQPQSPESPSSPPPSSEPEAQTSTEEPNSSGTTTTIGGGSAPDVTISSSGGALTSGENEETTNDGETELESSEEPEAQPDEPAGGTETPNNQTPAPTSESGQSGSPSGSQVDTNGGTPQGSTGNEAEAQQGADPASGQRTMSLPQSGEGDQDAATGFSSTAEDYTTPSFDTFSSFSTMSAEDAIAPLAVTAPAPDPISTLLAFPAALFVAAVDVVVSFFEPVVGPGAPFENALLWGMLAWTRRQVTQTLANRTPEIGQDSISLEVDEDSAENPIGPLPATDADGDTITYSVSPEHGPANGSVDIVGNTVTYTPNAGYSGEDSFTLVASDAGNGFHIHALGQTHSDIATVSITVNDDGVNDAPVADDDTYTVNEDTTLTVGAAAGVLTGDTDAENDPLTAVLGTGPANGTLDLQADGSFTYTPNTGFTGQDTFTYTAFDGNLNSNTATVTITVNDIADPNTAPVADDDTYTVNEDTTLTVGAAAGVLTGDTDAENDPLTAVLGTGPANGTLDLQTDGSFTYTPDTGVTGQDTFTYTAFDGNLNSNTATVTITVNAPNTVVGTVDVGESPRAVSVTPDGSRVYVANFGNTFNENNGSVTVIDTSDPSNPTVLTTIPFDVQPLGVAVSPNGQYAYIPYDGVVGGNGHVLVLDIDPDSPTFHTVIGAPIEVGDGPDDVVFSPDGTRAFILNGSSIDVSVLDIDPDSPTFNTVIDGPFNVGNASPTALAITPDGARIYTTPEFFDVVTVLDVDPDSAGYGTLIGGAIPVGDLPNDVAVSPDGLRVYVVNVVGDSVSVIDTASNTVTATISNVGDSPQAIAFSLDGDRAYVANRSNDNVLVIDTDPESDTFNTVIGDIAVGDGPRGLAISSDGSRLYVINGSDRTVSVIAIA